MKDFVPVRMDLYGRVTRQVYDPDLIRLRILIRATEILKDDPNMITLCNLQIEGIMYRIQCGSC